MIETKWGYLVKQSLFCNSYGTRGDLKLNFKSAVKLHLSGFLVGLVNSNCGDISRIFSAESRP